MNDLLKLFKKPQTAVFVNIVDPIQFCVRVFYFFLNSLLHLKYSHSVFINSYKIRNT